MLRIILALALALGGGLVLTACGGDQIKGEGKTSDRPGWVDKGRAAMPDKAFYGVGVASNITDIGLRRSTADAQARTELAKVFSTRVQDLLKTYRASTTDGDKEAAEAHRQQATKVFTEMELSGVEIVDRFFDLQASAQFSLARLDAKAFDTQLEGMAALNKRAKDAIKASAAKAFAEIDEESAKQ